MKLILTDTQLNHKMPKRKRRKFFDYQSILTGFHPDPVFVVQEKIITLLRRPLNGFQVCIFHSKDLKNWRLISTPVNRVSQLNMLGNPDSGGVWAPNLSYSDGRFG